MPTVLKLLSVMVSIYGLLTLFPKLFVILNEQAATTFTNLMQPLIEKGPIPIPMELHIWHGLIGSLIWIIAGTGLWKRHNWSRWLMALWGLTVLFLTFSVYGLAGSFIWKSATYLILLGLLFNPKSRGYFEQGS